MNLKEKNTFFCGSVTPVSLFKINSASGCVWGEEKKVCICITNVLSNIDTANPKSKPPPSVVGEWEHRTPGDRPSSNPPSPRLPSLYQSSPSRASPLEARIECCAPGQTRRIDIPRENISPKLVAFSFRDNHGVGAYDKYDLLTDSRRQWLSDWPYVTLYRLKLDSFA